MGLGDVNQSSDFMKAILSGDPTKIGQVLGPQIRGIQQQGVQAKKTTAEFHNRGGGTNASLQRIGDTTRSSIQDLISSLTGSAVSGLASTGMGLLNNAQSGFATGFDEAKTMHDQNAAKWNDIFKSITSIGAGVVGGIPAGAGSVADIGSNILGAAA